MRCFTLEVALLSLPEDPQTLLNDASGTLLYIPNFWPKGQAKLFDTQIAWRQDTIHLFDKTIPLPRLTAWYGDPDTVYVYSGIRNVPLAWIPDLTEMKRAAEAAAQASFNSVLANRYADGQSSMSWHADDEPSLGPLPTIASVSLGGVRRFVLKHKQDGRKLELSLDDGSLLIMAGALQQHWLHAVPKTKKPVDLRLNFTFRSVRSNLPTKAKSAPDN